LSDFLFAKSRQNYNIGSWLIWLNDVSFVAPDFQRDEHVDDDAGDLHNAVELQRRLQNLRNKIESSNK
jgi:hypothetical protein